MNGTSGTPDSKVRGRPVCGICAGCQFFSDGFGFVVGFGAELRDSSTDFVTLVIAILIGSSLLLGFLLSLLPNHPPFQLKLTVMKAEAVLTVQATTSTAYPHRTLLPIFSASSMSSVRASRFPCMIAS